ncbi:MAG: HAMP domain-containing histidine kinase [Bacilli bacterium]|jgi:signal transduction histidine kinase|nr:HAMP domain-containing histidine kinase [Bacilli bacterium]
MSKKWNSISLKNKLLIITLLTILFISIIFLSLIFKIADSQAFIPMKHMFFEDQQITFQKPHNELAGLFEQRRQNFIVQSIILIILIVIIGCCSLYLLLTRTIKPLQLLAKDITNINENNLDMIIVNNANCLEVKEINNAFNTLLTRLARVFESQKLFSANLAHELKTPLSIIKTNHQVFNLQEKRSKKEYQELLSIINIQNERLIEIVDTLLKMNDNQSIIIKTFSLNKMVKEIKDDLLLLLQKEQLELIIEGDYELNTDDKLFKRALFNIIDNAIKYHGQSKRIEVIINNDNIKVIDYGIGIPEDDQDKIFEPFYRVDNSRSRHSGGSGLGLSLSKQILKLLDYEISIVSREDGTTLIIHY